MGMSPANVTIDSLALSAQLHALISYLIDNKIVDQVDLDCRFLKLVIERKKESRNVMMQQIARSKVIGPDGKPIT